MSSKKASFESRDPSHTIDEKPADAKEKVAIPAGKASFAVSDPSPPSIDEPINFGDETAIAEKASFYARDPGIATKDPEKNPGKKKYVGLERRRDNRRSGTDRRSDVRFELDKQDRRQNDGRRENDFTPKYW